MTYLITGGAGFIGSNLACELVRRRQKVKIIDNLSSGSLKKLKPVLSKIEFVKADIKNLSLLKKHFKGIDFVLHQAALSSVAQSIKEPLMTHQNNVTGTLNVLIAARDCQVKRVVFASSAAVYGDHSLTAKNHQSKRPCKCCATILPNPLSPYALSKVIGENYCKLFYQLYGLETICLRYFNVYGPGQNLKSEYASVIPVFIKQLLADNSPQIYGTGRQSRDFIYIDDVIRSNLLACQTKQGPGEVFNIASGKSININKLAQLLAQILNKKIKPIYKDARLGDIFKSQADIFKAHKILNFKAKIEIKHGLKKYIQHDRNLFCL